MTHSTQNTAAKTVEQLKADTLQRMKAEIIADMKAGRVPNTVAFFSELHDYVDANEYGGFCDDAWIVQSSAIFGGTDSETGEMPEGLVTFTNECQDAIDMWLQTTAVFY